MRRCRDTPDWWMPISATMSFTCRSPRLSATTTRRRVGSANVWKPLSFISMHMRYHAYYGNGSSGANHPCHSSTPDFQFDTGGGETMARIFITGSTDGLGLAAARTLMRDGHEIVLQARS